MTTAELLAKHPAIPKLAQEGLFEDMANFFHQCNPAVHRLEVPLEQVALMRHAGNMESWIKACEGLRIFGKEAPKPMKNESVRPYSEPATKTPESKPANN